MSHEINQRIIEEYVLEIEAMNMNELLKETKGTNSYEKLLFILQEILNKKLNQHPEGDNYE